MHNVTGLVLASLVLEICTLLWSPAKEASVPNIVPSDRLTSANSLSLAAAYGTFPVAAVFFALLAQAAKAARRHRRAALLQDRPDRARVLRRHAHVPHVGLPHLHARPARRRSGAKKKPNGENGNGKGVNLTQTFHELKEGWHFIFVNPVVRSVNLGLATGLIGGGMLVPLGSIFARDILGAGAAGYGVFITALGFGVAAGVLLLSVTQKRLPKVRIFELSIFGAGGSLIFAASMSSLTLAVIGVFVLGICGGAVYVVGFTLLHENVDDELRGRIFSALYTIVRLCLLIAFALGPFLSELLDHISRTAVHESHDHRPRTPPLRARRTPHAVVGRAPSSSPPAWSWCGRCGPAPVRSRPSDAHRVRRRRRVGQVDAGRHPRRAPRCGPHARARGDAIGARLREMVLDPNANIDPRAEALLLAADRAQHMAEVIGPALAEGRDVVTDRYLYSSLAYQAFGRGLDATDVRALSTFAAAPEADLVILITVSPETRAQRLKATPDRIEASGDEFHQRVENAFATLAGADPRRWVVIDGDTDVDEVAARVWHAVSAVKAQ